MTVGVSVYAVNTLILYVSISTGEFSYTVSNFSKRTKGDPEQGSITGPIEKNEILKKIDPQLFFS